METRLKHTRARHFHSLECWCQLSGLTYYEGHEHVQGHAHASKTEQHFVDNPLEGRLRPHSSRACREKGTMTGGFEGCVSVVSADVSAMKAENVSIRWWRSLVYREQLLLLRAGVSLGYACCACQPWLCPWARFLAGGIAASMALES